MKLSERLIVVGGIADCVELAARLEHDLANAQCAARLMSEAYDMMALKYEAKIKELEQRGMATVADGT